MTDNRDITWAETDDPAACQTNETVYQLYSRDPVRTPFQVIIKHFTSSLIINNFLVGQHSKRWIFNSPKNLASNQQKLR